MKVYLCRTHVTGVHTAQYYNNYGTYKVKEKERQKPQ